MAFGSLWYWITVALIWTRVTHAPFGVPIDLYGVAEHVGGQGDAFVVLRAGVAKQLELARRFGAWMVGLWAFGLSSVASLAVAGIEWAQALVLLGAPLALAQVLTYRAAVRLSVMEPSWPILSKALQRHRLHLQLLSITSIFASAAFGMISLMAAFRL